MKYLIRIAAIAALCVAASERGSVEASELEAYARRSLRSDAPRSDAPPSDTPISQHADTNALSLDHILRDVLQNNPSLKAARANWEAMKQRVPQARTWEDARAGFDTVAGRFVSIPPNSFTDQKLMVEQPVPLSGRNRLRGAAAEAEAMVAFADLHRRELDLLARGRT